MCSVFGEAETITHGQANSTFVQEHLQSKFCSLKQAKHFYSQSINRILFYFFLTREKSVMLQVTVLQLFNSANQKLVTCIYMNNCKRVI